jgi:Uma2 family endonuclease
MKPLKMTLEEFNRFPEDHVRRELLDGELHVSPSPENLHQVVQGEIYLQLRLQIPKRQGMVVMAPSDVRLSDKDLLQPDIYVVLKTQVNVVTMPRTIGAPALAIEVLSPSNPRYDRVRKRPIYARNGVQELWLVDPRLQRVEQLVLHGPEYQVAGVHHEKITAHVLPSVTVDLTQVWSAA